MPRFLLIGSAATSDLSLLLSHLLCALEHHQAHQMALYYDAANILSGDTERGSLKSRIYADTANIKSKPAQVYALITECAKYDVFLKEVIDNAGLLAQEPKVRDYSDTAARRC